MENREIKFRFRLKLVVDEWGTYKKGDIDTFIIPLLDDKNGLVCWKIDNQWEILSCDEFTGLKDKNEKEIYEGDIVRCGFYNHNQKMSFFNQEICFESGCFVAKSDDVKIEDTRRNVPLFWMWRENTIEVIGNVYENSNLIE